MGLLNFLMGDQFNLSFDQWQFIHIG